MFFLSTITKDEIKTKIKIKIIDENEIKKTLLKTKLSDAKFGT